MLVFANPWFLFLFLPASAAVYALYRGVNRDLVIYSKSADIQSYSRTWRTRAVGILPPVFLAGIFCLITGLARPRLMNKTVQRTAKAVAIEMVLDVSSSMGTAYPQAGESGPSRLAAVKAAFRRFVNRRPDDLIGLVTFAGYPATRCPLTSDHKALLRLLREVRTAGASGGPATALDEFDTALGDGLAAACARMKQAPIDTKLIILLSDGAANAGVITPAEAAAAAGRMGIRVYTVGIGAEDAASGDVDEVLLRMIAQRTGGRYFNAGDSQGLEEALLEISEMEKTEVQITGQVEYRELYPYVTTAGLLLVVACAFAHSLLTGKIL
ncbi:MAG: VWA domain-containing protein [Kiritimatiellia bacterium]